VRLLIKGRNQDTQNVPDTKFIEQLSRSHQWLNELLVGKVKSIRELADQENVHPTYVTRVLDRALLAPEIVRAIIKGSQPPGFNLETLKKNLPLPIDWGEQKKLLGF
jgi:site-specific DNA recombinase